ncbi:histidine kinase N-terminal domain-containing protein [Mitsuokella jalaludinii]|uniref:histidine kinase N-terminal domain-containing protein n=1 Tax=Mitsuokella jalaludinii TaxID=187979 RepID=UPI00265D4734|nr:histidine kinase N-terminal domain-containing protein [uncultured Mitsuokella sp.]
MDDITRLCRAQTRLTMLQISLLARMAIVFPFLADLAHGELKVYVKAKAPEYFLVIAQQRPHTVYLPGKDSAVGKLVRCIEEPLIKETFQTGKPARGKREWNYGSMIDMFTFGIHDGDKVIGVLNFEVDLDKLSIEGYSHLLDAAVAVLYHARHILNPEQFRPITASDGIIITDAHSRIVFADAAAQRIYRVLGVGSLRGGHLFDRQMTQHVTRETVETERPWQKEITAGGLILIRREIVIREGGNLCMRIVIISDVTETRAKDKEIRIKSAVIQEIHHRVKNNLQAIASLLRIQARRAKTAEVKAALKESVNRILSISVVHEYLSQQGSEDIDVQEVMGHIFDLAARNMTDREFTIRTEFRGPRLILPSKCASSVALVLNELVLNAMEHAFTGRKSGLIGLVVQEDEDHWHLDFYDDGVGLPEDFETRPRHSLGLTIVQTLVEGDLGGTFSIENDERGLGHGAHARLRIPKVQPNPTDEGQG